MKGVLKMGDGFTLPIEAVTESIGFLGRKGSGKTYAAQKLAEEMHAAHAQFVAIDPVGVWYGLRLSADGKSPGLAVPVMGGLHGDIPLEPAAGAVVANLIVDRGISAVLDLSQFEYDADKARFAKAFVDRFFFRKKASPSAVHVFVEECQEFVPQNPQREEGQMLHAFTRMAKIGRNFGIGISLISQRPQEVNKKVLNLTELLFAFQLTGPQERKTLQGWIADKGIEEDIAGELPKLEQGKPHVWSPAWLKISRVVAIGEKSTFDASSTPKVGSEAAARTLSPIDLAQLRTDMAATIEKAKAEDPKVLRAEIAKLKAEAKKHSDASATPAWRAEYEAAHARDTQAAYHDGWRDGMDKTMAWAVDQAKVLDGMLSKIQISARLSSGPPMTATEVSARQRPPGATASPVQRQSIPAPPRSPHRGGDPALGNSGLRRMLIALAQRPQGLNRRQLGVRAGMSSRSGTFDTYLAKGRTSGWIDGGPERLTITDRGIGALGHYEPLPEGRALLEHWLGQLGQSGGARMLRALAEAYPDALSREALGAAADMSPTSGTFDTYLSRLRSLELADGRGTIIASEELFR